MTEEWTEWTVEGKTVLEIMKLYKTQEGRKQLSGKQIDVAARIRGDILLNERLNQVLAEEENESE